MKFNKCPKCYSYTLEKLETHSICHDCNFNSVEGYVWGSCRDPINHRSWEGVNVGLPVYDEDQGQFVSDVLSKISFSEDDCEVICTEIKKLKPIEQTMLFLRFWRGFDYSRIAKDLNISVQQVERDLKASYLVLKSLCLENPKFSLTQFKTLIADQLGQKEAAIA